MINILRFICFVLFSFSENQTVQTTGKSWIMWKSETKLKWSDFQGRVDSLSTYNALTSTLIQMTEVTLKDDFVEYDFNCFFVKENSWTKDRKSITLLKHEQLHFDIAELATRRMRQKFATYNPINIHSTLNMLDTIFNAAELERRRINFEYDSETNHGLIVEKQNAWEQKIASELKKLDKYSLVKVRIRNKVITKPKKTCK